MLKGDPEEDVMDYAESKLTVSVNLNALPMGGLYYDIETKNPVSKGKVTIRLCNFFDNEEEG